MARPRCVSECGAARAARAPGFPASPTPRATAGWRRAPPESKCASSSSSRPLQADVASASRAGIHQLPHQIDPLLPEFHEFGVLRFRLPLHQVAVDYGNAVFQLCDEGRRVTAQNTTIYVIPL